LQIETEMSCLHSRQHYFGRLKTRTTTTTTTKRPNKERTQCCCHKGVAAALQDTRNSEEAGRKPKERNGGRRGKTHRTLKNSINVKRKVGNKRNKHSHS